jgi:hypothetical protein
MLPLRNRTRIPHLPHPHACHIPSPRALTAWAAPSSVRVRISRLAEPACGHMLVIRMRVSAACARSYGVCSLIRCMLTRVHEPAAAWGHMLIAQRSHARIML